MKGFRVFGEVGDLLKKAAELFSGGKAVRTVETQLEELRDFQRPEDRQGSDGRGRTLEERLTLAQMRRAGIEPPRSREEMLSNELRDVNEQRAALGREISALREETTNLWAACEAKRAEIQRIEDARSPEEKAQIAELRARRKLIESEITDLKAKHVRAHSQTRLLHSMAEGLGRLPALSTAPTDPAAYQAFLSNHLKHIAIT